MAKILLSMTLSDNGVIDIHANLDVPLVELSGVLTQAYSTMLCKGGSKWTTMQQPNPTLLHLTVTPNRPLVTIEYAHFSNTRWLINSGLIPASLSAEEVWQPEAQDTVVALPGYQRMAGTRQVLLGNPGKGGRSILSFKEMNGSMSVAELAYGIADSTVTFFCKGASHYRVQLSEAYCQFAFDVGIAQKDIPDLFLNNNPTYPLDGKVSLIKASN